MRTKLISRVIAAGLLVLGVVPAQATQTIVGSFPSMNYSMATGSFDITPPTSNSPGKWTFTADNPLVATIVGTKVTLLGSGYTRITGTQAASGAYNAVSRVTQLLVTKGNPTLETWAPMTVPYSAGKFTLVAPKSNSDGAWSYTINGAGIVTQAGNVLTLLDGGTVYINARQASTPGWNSVTAYTTLTVTLITPTVGSFGDVTFNRSSISNLTLVPPTSNSSGSWSFSSSDPSVATISGTVLTPVSIGKTTITATQAKAKPYGAATATMVLTVVGTAPAAGAFNDITSAFVTGGTNKYTLVAPTSSSPGAWTFTSSDSSIATVSGTVVTFVKPGVVTLTANQAATGTYDAVGPLSAKLTITQAPTVGVVPTVTKVIGDPDFALPLPTTNSSSAFVFTSSDANVISVTGGTAKIVGAGSATITATLPAKDYWLSGSTSFAIQVLGTLPTLGAFNPIAITTADKNVAIVAPTSTSKGVWVFTSSNPAVALVTGSAITGVAVGTATITAVQSPSGVFGQSNTLQTTVTVTAPIVKPTPVPTPSAVPTPVVTAAPVVQPTVKVVLGTKLITVTSSAKTIKVFIDGRAGIVGKNVVKAGKHVVQIQNGAVLLYSKLVTVK
jgi:hypothetical protein